MLIKLVKVIHILGGIIMKKLFIIVCLLGIPFTGWTQLFVPGNVIFADPFFLPDGQIVELKITGDEAEVVNVVRWDLQGAVRRRALGLDIDPAGQVWVGVTWTGDAESEYPEGIGQALRIKRDGTQDTWDLDILKSTHLAALETDVVMVNSNVGDQDIAQRLDVTSGDPVLTDFVKTGHGEALKLPDGRILMGQTDPGILVFDDAGNQTGVFFDDGETAFRSLTYNDEIGAVVASSQDQHTLMRISLDGELEETYDASDPLGTGVGFTSIWGIAQIPGSTQIIIGNHNVEALANTMGIFDGLDLASGPRLIEITSGFEQAGLDPGTSFRSFFNMAVVPGAEFPSNVEQWELY